MMNAPEEKGKVAAPETNHKPRVGFFICHCGSNIAGKVNVSRVAENCARHPYVTVSRDYKFMCSDPGQELIKKEIAENGLERVGSWPRARRACTRRPSGVPA